MLFNCEAIKTSLLLVFLAVLFCHTKDASCKSIFSVLKDNHIHFLVKRAPNATAQIRPNSTTITPQQNELKDMLEKWGLLLENARLNGTGPTVRKASPDKETRWWSNDNSNDNADQQPEEVLHENGYYSWQGYYSRLGSPGTEKKQNVDNDPPADSADGPKDRPVY